MFNSAQLCLSKHTLDFCKSARTGSLSEIGEQCFESRLELSHLNKYLRCKHESICVPPNYG